MKPLRNTQYSLFILPTYTLYLSSLIILTYSSYVTHNTIFITHEKHAKFQNFIKLNDTFKSLNQLFEFIFYSMNTIYQVIPWKKNIFLILRIFQKI